MSATIHNLSFSAVRTTVSATLACALICLPSSTLVVAADAKVSVALEWSNFELISMDGDKPPRFNRRFRCQDTGRRNCGLWLLEPGLHRFEYTWTQAEVEAGGAFSFTLGTTEVPVELEEGHDYTLQTGRILDIVEGSNYVQDANGDLYQERPTVMQCWYPEEGPVECRNDY